MAERREQREMGLGKDGAAEGETPWAGREK